METYEAPKSAALVQAQQKADQAAAKSAASKKKVEDLKAKKEKSDKPPKDKAVQTKDNSPKKDGMVISIEAIKKPEGANKAQELKAMEEALKKATEEAHKQRMELTGEKDSAESGNALTQAATSSATGLKNKALQELKAKQEAQQKALLDQLAKEEKERE